MRLRFGCFVLGDDLCFKLACVRVSLDSVVFVDFGFSLLFGLLFGVLLITFVLGRFSLVCGLRVALMLVVLNCLVFGVVTVNSVVVVILLVV